MPALVVAGCASPGAPPPPLAATASGSATVGAFPAVPGDLWIGGRCAGGGLEVRVEPVTVLPIDCSALGGEPFLNQIVMARRTTVTVSVTASTTVTWSVQVRQGGRARPVDRGEGRGHPPRVSTVDPGAGTDRAVRSAQHGDRNGGAGIPIGDGESVAELAAQPDSASTVAA